MATLTKTYTDNHYDSSTYKKTWTVTYNFNDITASNSTFTFVTPTIQAKFTGTKGLYRYTDVEMASLYIDNVMDGPSGSYGYDSWFWSNPANYTSNFIAGTSNTVFTITKRTKDPMDQLNSYPHSFVINTADYFDSNNKTSKTLTVKGSFFLALETNSLKDGTGYSSSYRNSDFLTYTLGTVTLNAPPTATYTVNTSGPYYSKAGGFTGSNYNISISYAAQYGGDVTSIKLQVGDNVNEFNPDRASGQKDLSIHTTQTGTFTPTLTITDTRGQKRVINLPSITIKPYESPTLDYNIQRTNSQGQPADEGAYARINTNLTYFNIENNHILEPTVVIKDGDTTLTTTKTWYTANGNSISDWSTVTTPATVYAIVSKSNGFTNDKSYNVSVTLTDTNGVSGQTISQILPTAFYMLDFRAGGHGMAIGKVADKDGLEIQFPTMIGEGLSTPLLQNGEIDISKYQLVIGKYNEVVDDAIFVIGAGSNGNPSNVFVIDENGNLTLRSRQDSSSDRYTGLNINHNPYIDDDGLGNITTYDASVGALASVLNYTSGNITYQHTASLSVSSNEYPTMGNTVQLDTKTYNTTQSTPVALKTANLTLRTTTTTSEITMDADNIILTSAGNLTLAGHSSPIGAYDSTSGSVNSMSTGTPTETGVNYRWTGTNFELGEGRYILVGRLSYATNATGRRVAVWGTSRSSNDIVTISLTNAQAVSGAVTNVQSIAIVNVTTTTTYYLMGLQNSGSSLNVNSYARWIRIR